MILQRSFKQILMENLSSLFSWRGYVIPIGMGLIILIQHPNVEGFKVIWYMLTWPKAWGYFFILFIVDALVRATYWYFRERNSRYIAKMERNERLRQEKTDAKNK